MDGSLTSADTAVVETIPKHARGSADTRGMMPIIIRNPLLSSYNLKTSIKPHFVGRALGRPHSAEKMPKEIGPISNVPARSCAFCTSNGLAVVTELRSTEEGLAVGLMATMTC